VIASASITTAPWSVSKADTVDFPDPMPPVSPIVRMAGPYQRTGDGGD
jgi:hypothetical protein